MKVEELFMKSFFAFVSMAVVSSVAVCLNEPISFEYKYKVISNSNHPFDVKEAYNYKEKLIDQYESLVFGYQERDYQTIIKQNLNLFEFSEDCSCYYNGQIVLVIGNGTGLTLEGDLRHNVCDENAIREKFYIFELFN